MMESALAVFLFDERDDYDGLATTMDQETGELIDEIFPGMIVRVRGSKTIETSKPTPVGGYAEYMRAEIQTIAAGLGMTYELLSGDLSKANYSSLRAGLIEFRRLVRQRQRLLIYQLCRRVRQWWLDAAIGMGVLRERAGGYPCTWTPPQFEEVDRVKEILADLAEIRAHVTPPQEIVARRGGDPQTVLDAFKRWNDDLDERGLVSDADPRATQKSGAIQSANQAGMAAAAGGSDAG
jgi:capsid protein